MDIRARERNGARDSLQLAHPPSSGEGEEEQGLLGELAKRDLREAQRKKSKENEEQERDPRMEHVKEQKGDQGRRSEGDP